MVAKVRPLAFAEMRCSVAAVTVVGPDLYGQPVENSDERFVALKVRLRATKLVAEAAVLALKYHCLNLYLERIEAEDSIWTLRMKEAVMVGALAAPGMAC